MVMKNKSFELNLAESIYIYTSKEISNSSIPLRKPAEFPISCHFYVNKCLFSSINGKLLKISQ